LYILIQFIVVIAGWWLMEKGWKMKTIRYFEGSVLCLNLFFEDTKSSGDTEKSKKIKADFEKQLQRMKQEMGKLQVIL